MAVWTADGTLSRLGGQSVLGAATAAEACQLGGQDWPVRQERIWTESSGPEGVPGLLANVRGDNGEVLSILSSKFHPLQNAEGFDLLDNLVEGGELSYESAGCFGGGRQTFVSAKVKSDPFEVVPGDLVEKYLFVVNSHDGSLAVRCSAVAFRIVCQNTMQAAYRSQGGLRVRHNADMHKKLAEARRVLGIAERNFEDLKEQAEVLARTPVSDGTFRQFTLDLLGLVEGETSTREEQKLFLLRGNFEEEEIPQVRGTAWGALQAVTKYTSHQARTQERTKYSLLGDGAALVHQAQNLLLSYA